MGEFAHSLPPGSGEGETTDQDRFEQATTAALEVVRPLASDLVVALHALRDVPSDLATSYSHTLSLRGEFFSRINGEVNSGPYVQRTVEIRHNHDASDPTSNPSGGSQVVITAKEFERYEDGSERLKNSGVTLKKSRRKEIVSGSTKEKLQVGGQVVSAEDGENTEQAKQATLEAVYTLTGPTGGLLL